MAFGVVFLFFKSAEMQKKEIRADVEAYNDLIERNELLHVKLDAIYDKMYQMSDENIDNDIDEGQDNQGSQEVDLDNPMLHVIDNDDFDDDAGFNNSQVGSDATQGLTPVHHQNIDESRIDELLVEENLDDSHYPSIADIADKDAAKLSHDNDF